MLQHLHKDTHSPYLVGTNIFANNIRTKKNKSSKEFGGEDGIERNFLQL